MIKKTLATSACLLSLFSSAAWAGGEEYPPKVDVAAPNEKSAPAKVASAEPLAKTGTDALPLAMVAAGLIAVGGALVVSVRSRRTNALAVTAS